MPSLVAAIPITTIGLLLAPSRLLGQPPLDRSPGRFGLAARLRRSQRAGQQVDKPIQGFSAIGRLRAVAPAHDPQHALLVDPRVELSKDTVALTVGQRRTLRHIEQQR